MPSTELRFTDLLFRPPRHHWERSIAYVFRLASLNHMPYRRLAPQAAVDKALCGEPSGGIGGPYGGFNHEAFRLSLAGYAGRPRRLVCPLCIREGRPDSVDQVRYPYLEYCLFHGCQPLARCPQCHEEFRYGSGSYERCQCGFELALATATFPEPGARRLYLAVAANIPLEMEPLTHELERQDLYYIHRRLHSTWHLLWEDQPIRDFVGGSFAESLNRRPPFGMRWTAASAVLGVAQHRLERWVTHIGCWWKHGRYKEHFVTGSDTDSPTHLVAWRYLRALIEQAVKSGCSGPSANACASAGYQCKTRRSGRCGDRLPTPFRSTIGPCMRPFVRELPRSLSSPARAPVIQHGAPQSLRDLAALAPDGARKAIELVAIGAVQPLELNHPLEWRFAAGEIDEFLRAAFNKYLPQNYTQDWAWARRPEERLQAVEMSMGGLFSELCFGQLKPLAQLPENIWRTRFVNSNGSEPYACAQRSLHMAVLDSLSIRSREAAVIAHSFLGFTADLHSNELELFCGPPPIPMPVLTSFPRQYPLDWREPLHPKMLVWRDGILQDCSLEALTEPYARSSPATTV